MLDDHREFLWWMIIVHGWEPTFYNHYHVMMLLGTDFLELRQAICKRKPQNQLRGFQRNADSVEPPGLSPTELQWFVKLFHHAINVHQSVGPYHLPPPSRFFYSTFWPEPATCVSWAWGISDLSVFHWNREQGEQLVFFRCFLSLEKWLLDPCWLMML